MDQFITTDRFRATVELVLMDKQNQQPILEQSTLSEQTRKDLNDNLEQYYTRVKRTISAYIIGTGLDADDLTQETFLKAFRSIDSFAGASSVYTWLYRIAKNTCIDAMRKLNTRGEKKNVEFDEELAGQADMHTDQILERERDHLLKKALANLEEEMRLLIVLKHLQQMKYDEISEITGLEVGTVKSKLFRARLQLKEELTKMGYDS